MFIRRTENNWFAKWWLGVDKVVLFAVLTLIIFGILIQFAASPYQARRMNLSDEYHFVKNISMYVLPGIFGMILVSSMKLKTIRKLTVISFIPSCLLLIITLFFSKAKGANRWINFGIIKIQPSEFLKPIFAIIIAMILVRIKDLHDKIRVIEKNNKIKKRNTMYPTVLEVINFIPMVFYNIYFFIRKKQRIKKELSEIENLEKRKNRYISLLIYIFVFICILLIAQPDVGMTVTFSIIFLSEIFVAGISWILVFALLGLGGFGLLLAYEFLPHFTHRVNQFLTNDNYQLRKALDAIKESNFLFGGHTNNLKTVVPDIHTDFIFAAVIEEVGPILSILIIMVFLTLITYMLYKLKSKKDSFVIFSGIGIISYVVFQIMFNLSSTLGIIPTKGTTLPFISYGGSSFISSCFAIGIILSLLQDQNLRR